jgi:hypothetical protein
MYRTYTCKVSTIRSFEITSSNQPNTGPKNWLVTHSCTAAKLWARIQIALMIHVTRCIPSSAVFISLWANFALHAAGLPRRRAASTDALSALAGVLRCGKRGGSSLYMYDGADDGGRDFYTGFQYKSFVWRIPTASLHTGVSWYNTAPGVWKMKFEIPICKKNSYLHF